MKNENCSKSDYTRVTTILSRYCDFTGIDPDVLANAARRGTAVHQFCELYVKNLLIEQVPHECEPYFQSFKSWFDNTSFELISVENRMYCDKLRITGQVDLIMKEAGSHTPIIIDIKTPQAEGSTWALQTAAYLYLTKQSLKAPKYRRACLMLNRRGGDAKFLEYTQHDRAERLFLNAVELYKYLN